MKGGILDWNGEEATGSETAGLEFFASGDYASTFAMAYNMERGLKQFYHVLAEREEREEEKELLTQLVLFEDAHMALLKNKHKDVLEELPEKERSDIMEGGLDVQQMIEAFGSELDTPGNYFTTGNEIRSPGI